jgi:integrase
MIIKRSIVFDLENRKYKGKLISDNVPIRIRLTYSGNRIELSTGLRIDRDKWDTKEKKVKKNCTNKLKQSASDINAKLSGYEFDLQNVFKKFEIEERIPTNEEVKHLFNQIYSDNKTNSKKKGFFEYLDEFILENGKQKNWTDKTYSKFETVKNHLKNFNSKSTFSYFDDRGLTSYVEFLRERREMRNSTIDNQVSFLKWFLKWAYSKGYNNNLAYQTFKPKLKTTQKKIIFLTPEELKKIKEFNIPQTKKYLERVRDVFLFSCYSGIRYSDAFNLKKTDIKDAYFEITTVKTNDSLIIELNKNTKEILEKYKDIPFQGNKALPVISNQRMNEYIQELGKLTEIEEPIRITYYKGNERKDEVIPKHKLLSTHAGRRTFICNACKCSNEMDWSF